MYNPGSSNSFHMPTYGVHFNTYFHRVYDRKPSPELRFKRGFVNQNNVRHVTAFKFRLKADRGAQDGGEGICGPRGQSLGLT